MGKKSVETIRASSSSSLSSFSNLTGKESLIRLVGKRRRILPNRPSLFSSSTTTITTKTKEEEEEEEEKENPNESPPPPDKGSVTCPVCGSVVVDGANSITINSHLDECLASGGRGGGIKRKLTQRTLLQFSFSSKSSSKHTNTINLGDHVTTPIPPSHDNTADFLTSNEVKALETFIVGRRFSEVKKLNQGDTIALSRDPDNVKDPNAIKVLSGCSKLMLGFLPRELAICLSPLIDNYNLSFEGSVISHPKHSLDVVPVRIICQEIASCGEKESNDLEVIESLWRSVLDVAENAKTFPPSRTKYQQNFCILIQEVMKNHHHLFTDDEKLFIESFNSLSEDSQRLFIRLYTRKGLWFRMASVSYPEVLNCQQAIEGLCATGYICSLESMKEGYDLKEMLDVLCVSELREMLSLAHLKRLFFLNGEQDLSAFLMVDLGIMKYPTYNCVISNQIFPTRHDLLTYEEAIEVAQIMDQSLDESNNKMVIRCIEVSYDRISSSSVEVSQSSIPDSVGLFLSLFSALSVYSKVVTLGISYFEREHRYEDAIRLLQLLLKRITFGQKRGYWTLRLSVDLEHISRLDESLSVAEEGLLDPWVRAGSKMALQRRVLRLGKPPRRWKTPSFSVSINRKIKEVHVLGRPLNCDLGLKNRFYGDDGEQCGVEQLALQYYAGEGGGWQGVHTESGIWMTIFGILMWDVIFADVPDVFHTRFQTAPLDLETDNFYIARKSLIESQLDKISGGMAEEILICSWESHIGTSCRGVNWDKHSLPDLRAAITFVGGPCLASLCRLLAQDYRSWSRGMPDLFLWRFVGEYAGEAKLVEVKGPRDRLSEQQRAWLLLLMDCGFNTEVCKVSPSQSK